MVEQVQGVRAEIDEQAAAGDRGVGPPEVRRCGMRRVWPVQGRAHAARRTDRAAVQQLLDLREAGQGASTGLPAAMACNAYCMWVEGGVAT
ncbi:hypothetical protein G6F32_016028 [Rhizopus arrhizus]|nr:hypothetical protein G6F32_016028 [Rhizopus arrhizus]